VGAEDVATRPLTDLPARDRGGSGVEPGQIFAVQAQTNEPEVAHAADDVVNRRKIRHAHMVNIKKRIMLEGMRADFQKGGPAEREGTGTVRKGQTNPAKNVRGPTWWRI